MKLTTRFPNLTEPQKVRKAPSVAPALDNHTEPAQTSAAVFLQRQVGNQALGHLGHSHASDSVHARAVLQRLVASPLQTNLTLGTVGDPYEPDGHRIAAQEMVAPTPAVPIAECAGEKEELMQVKFAPVQCKMPQSDDEPRAKKTGLPNYLKTGIESLSGISLNHVKVHYNSSQPAQLNALAYAQGSDIHIAPGQERHLPHEAWHVVQQAQGRVKPTMQMKDSVSVNDDAGLEQEAEVMGVLAAHSPEPAEIPEQNKASTTMKLASSVLQLFTAPPTTPPASGLRGGTLNADGVPIESHVTTKHGALNDLVGTVPSVVIHGWQHILTVNASRAWVRFHLVNQQVGGLGNQANLVPTSHATNHNAAWKNFETLIKNLASAQTGIHVTVDVTYPLAAPAAPPGTLAAVSHFYPTNISARVYYWNPVTRAYVLHPNQPNFAPFPLQPPAVAGVTDLSQQTDGWVKNVLMAKQLTDNQAHIFNTALQDGTAAGYRNISQEPTPEMQLLDALDEVGTVDCMDADYDGGGGKKRKAQATGVPVPSGSRIQVLNGSYVLP